MPNSSGSSPDWGTTFFDLNFGYLAEWSIAAVLNAVWSGEPRRKGSNPLIPAIFLFSFGAVPEWSIGASWNGDGRICNAAQGFKSLPPRQIAWNCARVAYVRYLESRWSQQCGASVRIASVPPFFQTRTNPCKVRYSVPWCCGSTAILTCPKALAGAHRSRVGCGLGSNPIGFTEIQFSFFAGMAEWHRLLPSKQITPVRFWLPAPFFRADEAQVEERRSPKPKDAVRLRTSVPVSSFSM